MSDEREPDRDDSDGESIPQSDNARDAAGDKSEWGFSEKKPRIGREIKIGLTLVVALLAAFGVVVFNKLNRDDKQVVQIAGTAGTETDDGTNSSEDLRSDEFQSSSSLAASTPSAVESSLSAFSSLDRNSHQSASTARLLQSENQSASRDPFGAAEDFSANGQSEPSPADSPFGSEPQPSSEIARQPRAEERPFDPFGDATTPQADDEGPAESTPALQPPARQPEPAFGLEESSGADPFGTTPQSEPASQFDDGPVAFNPADNRPLRAGDDTRVDEGLSSPGKLSADEFSRNADETSTDGSTPDVSENPFDSSPTLNPGSMPAEDGSESAKSTNPAPDDVIDLFGDPVRQQPSLKTPQGSAAQPETLTTGNDRKFGEYRAVQTERQSAQSTTIVQRPPAGSSPDDPGSGPFDFSQTDPASIDSARTRAQFGEAGAASGAGSPGSPSTDPGAGEPLAPSRRDRPAAQLAQSSAASPLLFEETRIPQRAAAAGLTPSSPAPIRNDPFDPATPSRPGFSSPARESLAHDSYVIEPSDTFWTISKKRYGTARYFQALALHNKESVPDPQRMRPGTKISTPSPAILETRFPQLFPGSTASAATDSQPLPHSSLPADPVKVEPGGFFVGTKGEPLYRIGGEDTLSDISQKHLGRSSRWIQIFQMNRDNLHDPHDLKVGTVLRLPPDASRVTLNPDAPRIR